MKQLLILLLSATLIISACSKSNDGSTSPKAEATCLVNTDSTYEKSYYKYDSQQRIIRVDQESAISPDFYTYSYSSNKIDMNGEYVSGGIKHSYSQSYNLDANGRIVNFTEPYSKGLATIKYNSDGYIGETSLISNGDLGTLNNVFHYTDGNLTKITSQQNSQASGASFSSVSTTIISYNNEPASKGILLGKVESSLYGILDEHFIELSSFIGKRNKNQVSKTETSTMSSTDGIATGNDINTSTFTYVKDKNGNIASYSKKRSGYPNPTISRFTYHCQ